MNACTRLPKHKVASKLVSMRQEQREKDQANLLDFALALISFPSVYTFALSFTLAIISRS